jgi:hypothetical protein
LLSVHANTAFRKLTLHLKKNKLQKVLDGCDISGKYEHSQEREESYDDATVQRMKEDRNS